MRPQKTLRAFLEANLRGDEKKAYPLLSAIDQRRLGPPPSAESAAMEDPLSATILARIRFEIEELKAKKNQVIFMVTTYHPDREALASLMADVRLDNALAGGQTKPPEKLMIAKIKGADFPMARSVRSFRVVKEGAHWRVRLTEGARK